MLFRSERRRVERRGFERARYRAPRAPQHRTLLEPNVPQLLERVAQRNPLRARQPEALQRCSQIWFDPILQKHAAGLPSVRVQYQTELESFHDDGAGVDATLLDRTSGRRTRVRAAYLAACDGADSAIREQLGIPLLGDHSLSFNINVFFRSRALDVLFAKGPALMQWIFGPEGMWADIV